MIGAPHYFRCRGALERRVPASIADAAPGGLAPADGRPGGASLPMDGGGEPPLRVQAMAWQETHCPHARQWGCPVFRTNKLPRLVRWYPWLPSVVAVCIGIIGYLLCIVAIEAMSRP